MNGRKKIISALLLGLALIIPSLSFSDSDADESVIKRGSIDDDYYAAGGEVDIDAEVAGDVIVAGGELYIGRLIEGDVMAAGGSIKIRGVVKDDVRVSGGELDIDAIVGDDLAASGGSITVSPGTTIGGEAWLAGGDVYMAGTVNKDLKIAGGTIRLSGVIHGDVELEGGEIQIFEGAQIDGNLLYKSPNEGTIDPGANISGKVIYEEMDWDYSGNGFSILFSLPLIAASILFFWLFPKFTVSSAERITSNPWKSLGLGIVIFIFTPLVVVILVAIVLGIWIGLSVLAIYLVALLLGFLIAVFFVGDRGAKLAKQNLSTTGRRILSVILAIFFLGFIQIIPVIGGLLLFALLLFGLGAGVLQVYFTYKQSGHITPG
jgi:hypothetical protein